jgi:hypothetical protein
MGSISLPAAIVAGSAISGGAGLLGSMTAGNKAADASREAARIAEQQYQTTRGDLLPFTQTGQNILPALTDAALTRTGGGPDYVSQAAALGSGPDMQAALERTPGYQFQLQQGLKATQSAAAARGLGVSGAALKGAATFATGLADSNYEKRFADLLQLNTAQQGNVQNRYSRLAGVGQLGESAAAGTGAVGANAANTAASATTAAGTAQAAGALGGANSIGNAVNSGINNYLGYQLAQKYLPGGGGGTGGYTGGGAFDPGIPLQSGGYTT